MILIIGSNGQLGRQIQKALTARGQMFAAYDYPDIDITSPASIEELVTAIDPLTIVNCAAYTNVDQAETDKDNAYRVNALGPKYLAEICRDKDIELVQVSTDYVFSGVPYIEHGSPRPYVEEDECCPQSVYGSTKLEGERFVQVSGAKLYVLRTAWLYGDGKNFVRTMLKMAEDHDEIRVVNDQIGSPTSTVDLANSICTLIGTGEYGLYHATCEGQCSWYDFAKMIFDLKGKHMNVAPLTSQEYL